MSSLCFQIFWNFETLISSAGCVSLDPEISIGSTLKCALPSLKKVAVN